MKRKLFLLAALVAVSIVNATAGALAGKFTVNAEGKQVQFASGNLQYNAYYAYWGLANHQYDYIGATNSNISSSYEGMIDLFGWGTSGYNGKEPYMTSTTSTNYGNPDNEGKSNIAGTKYDWGAMVEADIPGQWRTLTYEEWDYLFNTRANATHLRGQATVDGKHGYILLPDKWTTPSSLSFTATPNNWTSNNYSTIGWAMMEAAGAVFLPCSGIRINGHTVSLLDSEGYYWSSTADGKNNAYKVEIKETTAVVSPTLRQHGFAVRLVRDVPKYKVTLNIKQWNSSFEQGGTVAVQETDIDLTAVEEGTTIHLTATPDEGYIFDSWIGYNPETGLAVNSDTTVTAVFRKTWKITLPECEGGHVSVKYKDTDHELTAEELAAVPDETWVTVTAVPNEGWTFVEWSWPWSDSYTESSFNTPITMVDLEFKATFKKVWKIAIAEVRGGHATVSYASTGVELTAEELLAVPDGTVLTFTAVPDDGYRFIRWTPSSAYRSPTSPTTQQPITYDYVVTPVFKKYNTYAVEIQPQYGGEIVCTTEGVDLEEVLSGTKLTFKAIPIEGWGVNRWTGSPNLVVDYDTNPDIAELTVTEDETVTCYFQELPKFKVTFSAEMYPTISPAPRRVAGEADRMPARFIGGDVTCCVVEPYRVVNNGDYVEAGAKLRFVAHQTSPDFIFAGWSNIESTRDMQELVLTSDTNIIGYFKEPKKYMLTLQDDGNGVITLFNGEPGDEYYLSAPTEVNEGLWLMLTAHPNIGYEFDHWEGYEPPYFDEEEDDWIVPRVTGNTTVKAYFRPKAEITTKEGALPGMFTVGEDEDGKPVRVQFSKGNLQYIAGDGKTHKTAEGTAQGTWQFAAEQTEYIGSKNILASEDYDKPIDIYLWGASGYDNHYPWLAAQTPIEEDIAGTNYDWGKYNAISNGGNEPGLWRMLTVEEWDYLLYERCYTANPVYYGRQLHGVGTADGEQGFFLMPDGWVMPGELAKENVKFLPLQTADYVTNKYKSDYWKILQQSGVVFLPAGGARVDMGEGAQIMMVGQYGMYFTSSYLEDGDAYFIGVAIANAVMEFEGGATITGVPVKDGGCSVRLVRDVPASEIPDGVEDVMSELGAKSKKHAQKVLLPDGEIRIVLPDGRQYNLQGVQTGK